MGRGRGSGGTAGAGSNSGPEQMDTSAADGGGGSASEGSCPTSVGAMPPNMLVDMLKGTFITKEELLNVLESALPKMLKKLGVVPQQQGDGSGSSKQSYSSAAAAAAPKAPQGYREPLDGRNGQGSAHPPDQAGPCPEGFGLYGMRWVKSHVIEMRGDKEHIDGLTEEALKPLFKRMGVSSALADSIGISYKKDLKPPPAAQAAGGAAGAGAGSGASASPAPRAAVYISFAPGVGKQREEVFRDVRAAAQSIAEVWRQAGLRCTVHEVPNGDGAKLRGTMNLVYKHLAKAGRMPHWVDGIHLWALPKPKRDVHGFQDAEPVNVVALRATIAKEAEQQQAAAGAAAV